MATVTELVDTICADTGLDDTTGSDDRVAALSRLNRAYRRICAEVKRLIPSSLQLTAALDTALATAAPDLLTLDSAWRIDATDTDIHYPLERVSPERLLEMRGSGEGTPTHYAVLHGTLMLNAIESSSTSTIELRYTARPSALAEGDAEADIAGIDPVFHEDLLAGLACCYVLEGYEGQEERASYYRALYRDTLDLFKEQVRREGGVANIRVDDIGRWDTPATRSAR